MLFAQVSAKCWTLFPQPGEAGDAKRRAGLRGGQGTALEAADHWFSLLSTGSGGLTGHHPTRKAGLTQQLSSPLAASL